MPQSNEIVLTEDEFVARLLEVGGRDNSRPIIRIQSEESRFPLMRYLLVTTGGWQCSCTSVNPDRSLKQYSG